MHKIRTAPLLLLATLAFLLTACPESGGGGNSGAPQITNFSANPASIAAGTGSLLSWTITGSPTSLSIDSDVGVSVGTVNGTSVAVNPTTTTAYTLTASNSSGEATATTQVTVGGTPTGEDGLPPSGSFGVSASQTGEPQNDASGNISAGDPRIVNVAAGGTFYAQVSYGDPGGISSVSIRLANSSPAGLGAPLVENQPVGGFTLGAELTGCVLDGTQTAVSCVYPISVAPGTQNITSLPGAGGEFAYVFRTNVTDAAGSVSDTPPRGYVTVGGSGGTTTGGTTTGGTTGGTTTGGSTTGGSTTGGSTTGGSTTNGTTTGSSTTGGTNPPPTNPPPTDPPPTNPPPTNPPPTPPTENQAPTAKAGNDIQNAKVGVTVSLDGTGSTDPNPGETDTLKYAWSLSLQGGSEANNLLTNEATSKPSFKPATTGTYVAALVVTDARGLSSRQDTVSITVPDNKAPVADAGKDQTRVAQGDTVMLDGSSSSDPDAGETETLKYSWTLAAPSGASATDLLNKETTAKPTFKVPATGASMTEKYVAKLVVTDTNGAASSPASVSIFVD